MEHSEMLSLLLAAAKEYSIVLTNPDGIISAWLAGSQRVFGYEASEVVGRHFALLFTPEDIERHIPEYEMQAAITGPQAEDDRWMLRKDGVRFWATGILLPLHGSDRKLLGFGKVLRNRTDLKGLLESLEQKLLTEQKINESKNKFIYTLAHELRSPVSAALVALELLRRQKLAGVEGAQAQAAARRQLQHISKMIEDLLEATRIGAGKITLTRKRTLLNEIVNSAIETCHPSINEREQRLHRVIVDTAIFVDGEAERLEQVFVNLIQNASKFTPRGGDIWVKLDSDGDDAIAKVEDSGIGIAPEILPRIFDLFTQSEAASEEKQAGLGIGLSVVKELVAMHEGTIAVTSDGPGKGSKFWVRLPVSRSEA